MKAAMKAVSAVLVAAFIVALPACAEQTEDRPTGYQLCGGRTGVYRSQSGVLRVCAPITDAVVREVAGSLAPSDREVILTSDGGPQTPAIALARLLKERAITLRVRQFCLSSCSTYVMGMADRVIVDPHTVIAFHHTAAFLLDAMASRQGMAEDSWQRQASRSEREAYRASGRDDRMLDRIAMAVQPVCAGIRRVGGRDEAYIDNRWDWYIPDVSAMREIFGDRVLGDFTSSRDAAISIFRLSLGMPNAEVRFGSLPSGPFDPDAIGRALPECGSAES